MALPEMPPQSAAPERLLRLADLAEGSAGVVAAVDHDDAATGRLLDLGLTPGTEVTVVRRAPLGDPILYGLRGVRLALRRAEARRILVRPLPQPAA